MREGGNEMGIALVRGRRMHMRAMHVGERRK